MGLTFGLGGNGSIPPVLVTTTTMAPTTTTTTVVPTTSTTTTMVDLAIYIDPTNVASGRNGTIGNPYNSFVESGIVSNTTYKLKSNTTLSSTTPLEFS